jgi:hypothetical protein
MDQVGLAKSDTTINEQWVVGNAGVHRDLLGGCSGKIVGAAGYQGVKGEVGIETGFLVGRVGRTDGLLLLLNRLWSWRAHDFSCFRCGFLARAGDIKGNVNRCRKVFLAQCFDLVQISFAYPLHDEAIGCHKLEMTFRRAVTLDLQSP